MTTNQDLKAAVEQIIRSRFYIKDDPVMGYENVICTVDDLHCYAKEVLGRIAGLKTGSPRSAQPAPVAAEPDPVLCLSIAEEVVQTLSDSEPSARSEDGMDLLRGTPCESMFVLDGDDIRRVVALTLENAMADKTLFATPPPQSGDLAALIMKAANESNKGLLPAAEIITGLHGIKCTEEQAIILAHACDYIRTAWLGEEWAQSGDVADEQLDAEPEGDNVPPDELVSGWIGKAQGRYTGSLHQYRYVGMKYAEWVCKNSRAAKGGEGMVTVPHELAIMVHAVAHSILDAHDVSPQGRLAILEFGKLVNPSISDGGESAG